MTIQRGAGCIHRLPRRRSRCCRILAAGSPPPQNQPSRTSRVFHIDIYLPHASSPCAQTATGTAARHDVNRTYCGRFAPSPTGELHFGSLVAALAGWLRARQHHGTWRVRIEDIDPPREPAGSARSILAALERLGLAADATVLYQSSRTDAYAAALTRLREGGHAFPCWCSRAVLTSASARHRDGRCIARAARGRTPAWRLKVPAGTISFNDALQGPQSQDVREAVGDFVLKRADGLWGYQLACVVDDDAQGITEVVRGADLLDSTPRQILLQRLLGLPTPRYLHVPLAVDAAGHKLSKSTGARPVDIAHPHAAIERALRFLGQPVPSVADTGLLLTAAARAFDLSRLHGSASKRALHTR